MSMVDSFEKIPVKIFSSLEEGSRIIGKEIAQIGPLKKNPWGEKAVLGLGDGLFAQILIRRTGKASPRRRT